MADFKDAVDRAGMTKPAASPATVNVGPAPDDGSGSTRAQAAQQDYGDFSTVVPDPRNYQHGPVKEKLANVEKFAQFQTAAQSAIEAKIAGATPDQVDDAATQGAKDYLKPKRNERALPTITKDTQETDTTVQDMSDLIAENKKALAYKKGVGATDMAGAAWREMTGTSAAINAIVDRWNGTRDFKPDPLFNSMQDRDVWGKNMPVDDQEWVADSSSAEERTWKLGRLNEQQENMRKLGAHGAGAATFFSLGAGILDPVGWAAGLGVGKAAQLAKVGYAAATARAFEGLTLNESRVLLGAGLSVEGNAARSISRTAVEGAVGNVLTEKAIDASGEHVTAADYLYAAGFGVAFGAGGAVIANRVRQVHPDNRDVPGVHEEADATATAASTDAENIQQVNTRFMAGLWEEAQHRAGPDASADEIAQAATNIQYERANQLRATAHMPMADNERLMPDIQELPGQVASQAEGATPTSMDGSLTSALESQFSPLADRMEVGKRYGVTADTVPDNAQRLIDTEMLLRAERQAPTFDEARLNTLSSKLPVAIQSTAMVLARSKHPLMKWVAGHLLEQPTQAGGPRTTASVEHAIREREYNSYIAHYQDIYKAYRNQNGGSTVRDIFTKAQHWNEFNKAVSDARRNRAMGIPQQEHPLIRDAADIMDTAYDRLRRDQRDSRTLGSENLPDSSIGYFTRAIDARWLLANPLKREPIRAELERQLYESWKGFTNGNKFAKETAARYMDRAIREAHGGGMVPTNIHDPHAAAGLRDALAQGTNLSADDIEKYIDRISRGGAKHTKSRLDLDTTGKLKDANGQEFDLADAFVSDQAALFRAQARRVNGEVTLTRRGIQGRKGMAQLRDLASLRSEAGKEASAAELRALDQVIAEFTGQSFGKANRHLDNLRLLTMVSKLGQAVVPQLAETANMATTLGIGSAMRFTRDLPRLVQDVRKGRRSELLESLEVPGGRLGEEHQSIMPWQDLDEIELAGRDAPGMLDRVLRAGANAQSLATGFHYLHAAQVRGASEQILHKVMRYVKSGEQDAALRSMGLSEDLQKALKRDLKNFAQFDKDGALTSMDIRQGTNPQAMLALQQLVERGAKQIIQGTFIGERGAFMHDSFLKLLTQFRSFSITSMDKQLSRVRADQGTAKALGLLLGQMAFAVPIHLARTSLNAASMASDKRDEYLTTNLAPGMLARATLNYASLGGLAGDILDAGAALGGLEMSGVRSGQSSFSGNIPAIGYADGLVRGVTNKDMSALIKSLPGGNTIFLTPVANGLHALQH
ncbi:internal virion protein [Pseudomonas phage Eisa9]|uniref:Internal virion protein n=1 Tax=Pseudomonas phage Eisa9 TaxID=2900148 RepID=A0AAE9C8B5_9CAUD|nr:internal virion protein [Pseudomonas phage Eisa9]